jgi:hypothetical protein
MKNSELICCNENEIKFRFRVRWKGGGVKGEVACGDGGEVVSLEIVLFGAKEE